MTEKTKLDKLQRIRQRAELYRRSDPAFAEWAAGFGVIAHSDLTQVRIRKMIDLLVLSRQADSPEAVLACLRAADKVANAGLWLVAHMSYADNVYLDGRDLQDDDFKVDPEGHMGGSLNMVLAYSGYLAVNAATGLTRSWLMGQGHCVAAISALNLIVNNMTASHAQRYNLSDEGLTRFVRDFYSMKLRPDGYPDSPLGSHVDAHTAGGIMEGGYLGFAELYYVHMPMPGERLVAFLSDGAFEEQKGGDWAPRWWRAHDTGLVAPILIANGRRIDQRSTISMEGGVDWLRCYLRQVGFEPFDIDGRDPAAYAWAVWELEQRLAAHARAVEQGTEDYPVPLPYAIAEVPKGYGFANAGTNQAHNLPLGSRVRQNPRAQTEFNTAARCIWVPLDELEQARDTLNNHRLTDRPPEKEHPIAVRRTDLPDLPEPDWRHSDGQTLSSPMQALDSYFCRIVQANPGMRVRVGNPDEMRSNRLDNALDMLKHRVSNPEPGVAEAVDGRVITALNEESVVCAALANKGGLNLVASYEAFAVKMLGAVRQELIFARHQREVGRPPGWLSVPIVPTSHTWENGKNEISHQDPTFTEAVMAEMADGARVVFPADANTAMAALEAVYQTRGQIWVAVTPKRPVTEWFSADQARQVYRQGGITLRTMENAQVLLAAVGAYQLREAMYAHERLADRSVPSQVVYLAEPARFRRARDPREAEAVLDGDTAHSLFPPGLDRRVFVSHTRSEHIAGVLRPLDTGPDKTRFLGFINRGGTLDAFGMLFANRATWAHIVQAAGEVLSIPLDHLLDAPERAAVEGRGDPKILKSIRAEFIMNTP